MMVADRQIGAEEETAAGVFEQTLDVRLRSYRLQLVNRIYDAAGVLALLYLPMLAWRILTVGFHTQLRIHAAALLLALIAVPLKHRMSLEHKSALLAAAVLTLGLLGVGTLGMVGTGYWWCLQAAVLFATLFSMRAGIGVALLCAAAIAIAGLGFVSGALMLPFDMNEHVTSASSWGAFLVVVVFAPIALLLALVGYQQMIEKLVAEVDQQRRQLSVLVGHDALTGLPQMSIASERLDRAVAQSRRHQDKVALLFIDLDGFKLVNDMHGHAAGDHLLQEVAQRLRESVSAADTVARVGGDEFLIVLARLGSTADADSIAQRVLDAIGRPVAWQSRDLQVGASIGIALYPDHAGEAGMLRPLADAAMYGVKRHGRNGYRFAELR